MRLGALARMQHARIDAIKICQIFYGLDPTKLRCGVVLRADGNKRWPFLMGGTRHIHQALDKAKVIDNPDLQVKVPARMVSIEKPWTNKSR
jgi:hypothetical protein